MQQFDPLGGDLKAESGHASEIAARPIEARHQPSGDRIAADIEDNWDRLGRRLEDERRRRASWYSDDAHLSVDQVRRKRRQTVVVPVRPAVFDRDIAALDKPGLGEALMERRHAMRPQLRQLGAEEPDHRHRRLLRTRHHRPRAAPPPSSVMNSRRLMPSMGLPPRKSVSRTVSLPQGDRRSPMGGPELSELGSIS